MKSPPGYAPRSRGQAWTGIFVLLIIVGVTAAAWWNYREFMRNLKVLVEVNGHFITRIEAADALRATVWRSGQNWDHLSPGEKKTLREKVVGELVDEQLLSQWAAKQAVGATEAAAADTAFLRFTSQFEKPGSWQERSSWQGLDEGGLRELFAKEVHEQAALEYALATSVNEPTGGDAVPECQAKARVPEQARVSHMFLTSHDQEKPDRQPEIQQYYQQITGGLITLADLARKVSDDERTKKTGGDLGWFSRDRVPEDFAKVVFALKPGQMSTPFETELGWHIAVLHEKRPAREATAAEMKAEAEAMERTEARRKVLAQFLQGLRVAAKLKHRPDEIAALAPSD